MIWNESVWKWNEGLINEQKQNYSVVVNEQDLTWKKQLVTNW
jgi:hypothetical protein